MKLIILLAVAFSLVYAVPLSNENADSSSSLPPNAYFIENYAAKDHSKSEIRDGAGQYGLNYQTADGIHVSERGYLKPAGNGTYYFVKEGSYEYPDAKGNGTRRTVKFLADETGFNVLN